MQWSDQCLVLPFLLPRSNLAEMHRYKHGHVRLRPLLWSQPARYQTDQRRDRTERRGQLHAELEAMSPLQQPRGKEDNT